MALRIGLFYTAASLSGAFGGEYSVSVDWTDGALIPFLSGLLARGLAEIAPRGGLEGWRWIFIIEGLLVSTYNIVVSHKFSSNKIDLCLRRAEFLRPSKFIGVSVFLDD